VYLVSDRFPFVSVVMITYNHEKIIAKAIEGVLMQKTSFDYELIVSDDCSQDKTNDEIIKLINIIDCNENIIKYTTNRSNLGMANNFISALSKVKGKYVALCEGDDYWTDPYKLQKQVDFLEANPEFSICYHRVNYLYENGIEVPETLNTSEVEKRYTILDLAKQNIIHTPSVFFRKDGIEQLSSYFKDAPAGDYVLHMENAKRGDIYYMPDIMATYRIHSNSYWSSQPPILMLNNWKKVLEILVPEFEHPISTELKKQLISNNVSLINNYMELNEYETAAKLLQHMIARNIDLSQFVLEQLFSMKTAIDNGEKFYLQKGIVTALFHLWSQITNKFKSFLKLYESH